MLHRRPATRSAPAATRSTIGGTGSSAARTAQHAISRARSESSRLEVTADRSGVRVRLFCGLGCRWRGHPAGDAEQDHVWSSAPRDVEAVRTVGQDYSMAAAGQDGLYLGSDGRIVFDYQHEAHRAPPVSSSTLACRHPRVGRTTERGPAFVRQATAQQGTPIPARRSPLDPSPRALPAGGWAQGATSRFDSNTIADMGQTRFGVFLPPPQTGNSPSPRAVICRARSICSRAAIGAVPVAKPVFFGGPAAGPESRNRLVRAENSRGIPPDRPAMTA